jgi:hypothetical protein
MIAFLYQWTGNAVIATPNLNKPGMTYGQAYVDLMSFMSAHVGPNNSYVYSNGKTLGEMTLWQDEAWQWLMGSNSTGPLTITTSSLPQGIVGTPYTGNLSATGGVLPYTWNATGLPAGLMLASTGQITGTPTAAGTAAVMATVTDSATPAAMASGSVSLIVTSPGSHPLSITTSSLPAGVIGIPYTATLAAAGGTPPYSWAAAGLPAGLMISTSGQITGTPTTMGTSTVAVTVTDSATPTAGTAMASLALTVVPQSTTSNIPGFTYPIP